MSSLKLSEWVIMLLRISLIVLVVMLISGLEIFTGSVEREKTVILMDQEYLNNDELDKVIASFDDSQEVRVLDKGFSVITDDYVSNGNVDIWTLISHVEELEADSIVIYSPLRLNSFQSRYPQFKNNISWRTLPIDGENIFINKAYWQSADSLSVLIGSNVSDQLEYEYQRISKDQKMLDGKALDFNMLDSTLAFADDNRVKIIPIPSIKVGIHTSDEYSNDDVYITTAFTSLESYASVKFDIEKYEADQVYDMVVWLDDEEYGKNPDSEVQLKLGEISARGALVKKIDHNIYELTKRVNPYFSSEMALLAFPQALLSILNESKILSNDGYINDERLMNVEQLNTGISTNNKSNLKRASSFAKIDHWLWVLFLVLFIIERSLSLTKNI
jgi:hypothetical protein